MADDVDASIDPVQEPHPDELLDFVGRETRLQKLGVGDNTVLATRQPTADGGRSLARCLNVGRFSLRSLCPTFSAWDALNVERTVGGAICATFWS